MGDAGRVLVVDDDPAIREMIDLALSTEGYDVVTAGDVLAALDVLRSARPDLILLDLKMPVLDGADFAKLYRGGPGPQAPIVVITAAPDTAARAAAIGADAYLIKPFDLDDLLEVVGRYARNRPAT